MIRIDVSDNVRKQRFRQLFYIFYVSLSCSVKRFRLMRSLVLNFCLLTCKFTKPCWVSFSLLNYFYFFKKWFRPTIHFTPYFGFIRSGSVNLLSSL